MVASHRNSTWAWSEISRKMGCHAHQEVADESDSEDDYVALAATDPAEDSTDCDSTHTAETVPLPPPGHAAIIDMSESSSSGFSNFSDICNSDDW